MLAVAHPPLGVCLFLSLFAVSGQFSLLPSCHTKIIIKIQASLTAHWHDKGADWRLLAITAAVQAKELQRAVGLEQPATRQQPTPA